MTTQLMYAFLACGILACLLALFRLARVGRHETLEVFWNGTTYIVRYRPTCLLDGATAETHKVYSLDVCIGNSAIIRAVAAGNNSYAYSDLRLESPTYELLYGCNTHNPELLALTLLIEGQANLHEQSCTA